MIYHYICVDCAEKSVGKSLSNLGVREYQELCGRMAFPVKHDANGIVSVQCQACGGTNTKKIVGLSATYIRGYGYLDKKGVKNDVNLHLMTSGNDPYAKYRTSGDKSDLIGKLRKQKRHSAGGSDVFMR